MNRILDGLHDATDRIIDQQSKRIAELEAALQKIADTNYDIGPFAMWARSVARAALTK